MSMMYFKILRTDAAEGKDKWDYKKVDPALHTVEDLLRGINQGDGYAEVSEEEYLAEVAEGTESDGEVEAPAEEPVEGSEAVPVE